MRRIYSNQHRKASIVRNQITSFSQNKENLVHAKSQIQHKRIHHHFFEKIQRKINAEKLSAQPSLFSFSAAPFSVPALFFFQLQCLFLLFFSSGQHPSFLVLFSSALFLFSFGAPFSASASLTFLQPSFFFSLGVLPFIFQPKKLFSAQTFFSPNVFSLQPLFSSSFFCFILFWFSPLFFSFQFRCSFFFFSLAPFIQVPMFSLAASHLFYLNKFLISSNLE